VQESFGRKWQTWSDFVTGTAEQRLFEEHVARLLVCEPSRLRQTLAGYRSVLDAGCGTGWKAREFATNGQSWFGIDLSESVRPAHAQSRQLPNVHVAQADLLHPPFAAGAFDLAVADGVIHHTPDPAGAVRVLARMLAPGGDLAIYVYAKKPPIREFVDQHLRRAATRLSFDECVEFCKPITRLGESLAKAGVTVTVPDDISSLGIKAGRYDLQRLLYYHVMKCFYHPDFTFEENNLVNVDWYHPAYASTHTPDEVRQWFAAAGLEDPRISKGDSGIYARATKPRRAAARGVASAASDSHRESTVAAAASTAQQRVASLPPQATATVQQRVASLPPQATATVQQRGGRRAL
jgi:SAM-dependent methyltransferase